MQIFGAADRAERVAQRRAAAVRVQRPLLARSQARARARIPELRRQDLADQVRSHLSDQELSLGPSVLRAFRLRSLREAAFQSPHLSLICLNEWRVAVRRMRNAIAPCVFNCAIDLKVFPQARRLSDAMTLVLTLASRNLFHDRIRLIATVVGIVFSIVLVTVQLGVFLSFERMITTMIDHAQADVWIAPAGTKSFEGSALLAGRERFEALSVDGVAEVKSVVVGYTSWRSPKGAATPIFLVGTSVGASSNSAGLRPWNVVEGRADDLSMPDAVAIDRSYAEQLGVSEIGGAAEIGNQKARVVAITKGIRSFTTTPQVFTSLERARAYLGVPSSKANYFIVRLAPGADVAA